VTRGDAGPVEADKLTYDQLADHLPEILDGICTALEARDLEQAEPPIERDARMHGKVRWQQGYCSCCALIPLSPLH
jgi:hypothetical protein